MTKLPFNVTLLTLILSLAMSAGAMMVMLGGLIGAQIAPSPDLITLPVAMMIVGTAAGVIPVTRLMGKLGRKPVFIGVSLLACGAFLLAAYAVYQQHFYWFISAAFLIGLSIAGFQQVRFAAMESVELENRPKAASRVLLGGLVAAILGPELVTLGQGLFTTEYVGAFVLMSFLCLICSLLFMLFTETHCHHTRAQLKESKDVEIGSVLRHPLFIIALSSSVVGFALMSFIMTATPVHMHNHQHHSLEQTKWVIQSHILAMYLPSLVSGWLITKLGVYRIIVAGLLVYLATIGFALAGNELVNYWLALVLLGIGWNFLFLGGTVLLPQTHSHQQSFKIQGVHDFLVFSAQALASLGAGAMLYIFGWAGLMYLSLTIIALHILLLLWQKSRLSVAKKLAEVTE